MNIFSGDHGDQPQRPELLDLRHAATHRLNKQPARRGSVSRGQSSHQSAAIQKDTRERLGDETALGIYQASRLVSEELLRARGWEIDQANNRWRKRQTWTY